MDDLNRLRQDARLTVTEVCDLFGVNRRTWYNWATKKAPKHIPDYLQLKAGWINATAWAGWRMIKDQLHAPTGHVVNPEDFHIMPLLYATIEALERTIKDLKTPSNVVQFPRHRHRDYQDTS